MNKTSAATVIHTLELGPMENFIYLIEDTHSGRTAVVDPAWEAGEILGLAKQHNLIISDILLTHSHPDHINAIDGILSEFDAELHLTHAEAQFWGDAGDSPSLHYGGDRINLGDTEIEILHTPGHTPGSACYRVHDQLITGDTMFVFGCGRCDMTGGDPNQMFDTLNKIKRELPGNTEILPGHNYAVTSTASLAEQIEGNPFMHCDTAEDFVTFRMGLHGKVRQSPYDAVSKRCTHDWLENAK
jgi:hydroxyacylglutathione hydrolase